MLRRTFAGGIAAALAIPEASFAREPSSFDELERRYGGRLGVYAREVGSGRRIAHRAGEAFPMCSTFKFLAVSAILRRVERREDVLARKIRYTSSDLLSYAPVTKRHIGPDGIGTLSLAQLCAAAIEWSDNTAANLLVRVLGGPAGVTAFVRAMGDGRTRLDRNEPSLNSAVPGDPRDTTTPASMAADVQALVFGPVLGKSASQLREWMLGCRTSAGRIPAGLPAGWRSGNKTGTGDYATANDVAFLLPPAGAPIIVAAYFTASRANAEQQNQTLAAVGKLVAHRFR